MTKVSGALIALGTVGFAAILDRLNRPSGEEKAQPAKEQLRSAARAKRASASALPGGESFASVKPTVGAIIGAYESDAPQTLTASDLVERSLQAAQAPEIHRQQ